MINMNTYCILDFETSSVNPNECQPLELAAVMVEPRKLEIIEGSEFCAIINPSDRAIISSDNIAFHCKARKCTKEELFKLWDEGLSEKVAWEKFVDYTRKYHVSGKKRSIFTSPLPCWYNGDNFDSIIVQRLAQKYGNVGSDGRQNIFFTRDSYDVMKLISFFNENNPELGSYAFDNVRKYMGMDGDGAHQALIDVKQTAELLIRFIKLARNIRVRFKGAFEGAS